MSQLTCPTCDKKFDPVGSKALPFCSDRCRQIDLGRWLNESQRLPVFGSPDDDEVPEKSPAEADAD
jgi:endogenous inhibitor of DNA gyrase (YacG/DUF329 family)